MDEVSTPVTSAASFTATPFLHALIAGGIAGTSVDVALFPIDTLKTRLQAPQGFLKAGGFRGIYNGLGAAAIGSAPGAALFFCTYESMKPIVLSWQHRNTGIKDEAVSHMTAASIGEAAACLVRVPTEVIKSKLQTAQQRVGLLPTFQMVLKERHGGSPISFVFGGLYRGYGITLFREIPFAMIQFPLYERFKVWWSQYDERRGVQRSETVGSLQAAACGSVSGGIAAAFTTPLDVIKTRLMLGQDQYGIYYQGALDVIQRTYRQDGVKAFLSGIQPRVMWISIGGFVFFGAYEGSKSVLAQLLPPQQ